MARPINPKEPVKRRLVKRRRHKRIAMTTAHPWVGPAVDELRRGGVSNEMLPRLRSWLWLQAWKLSAKPKTLRLRTRSRVENCDFAGEYCRNNTPRCTRASKIKSQWMRRQRPATFAVPDDAVILKMGEA